MSERDNGCRNSNSCGSQTLAFDDPDRIARITGVITLASLAIACFLVLLPFLPSLFWAVILVFATWPIYIRLEEFLGGHKLTAALLMTAALATALILPLVLVATSVATGAEGLVERYQAWQSADTGPVAPPGWLVAVPWVGNWLADYWRSAASSTSSLIEAALPLLGFLREAALRSGITVGRGLLEISLSVLISFFIYRDGLSGLDALRNVVRRIAGEKALSLIAVAGNTMTGVVYGIVGTALVQGMLAAFGFWLAGVPAPFLLGTFTFLLALFPAGAPLIWLPAALWLLNEGQLGWGIFMLVWGTAVVSGVDNFLRPYLISKGSNLPFIVVLFGVIGGVITFGILGIFIGPTLLAIALALLKEWALHEPQQGHS